MIDSEDGQHENVIDAYAVSVPTEDGDHVTLVKALKDAAGVKKGAAVAAMGIADPAAAAGSPTKAEYDALLAYAKGLKATLNALIASLKGSGAIG